MSAVTILGVQLFIEHVRVLNFVFMLLQYTEDCCLWVYKALLLAYGDVQAERAIDTFSSDTLEHSQKTKRNQYEDATLSVSHWEGIKMKLKQRNYWIKKLHGLVDFQMIPTMNVGLLARLTKSLSSLFTPEENRPVRSSRLKYFFFPSKGSQGHLLTPFTSHQTNNAGWLIATGTLFKAGDFNN